MYIENFRETFKSKCNKLNSANVLNENFYLRNSNYYKNCFSEMETRFSYNTVNECNYQIKLKKLKCNTKSYNYAEVLCIEISFMYRTHMLYSIFDL